MNYQAYDPNEDLSTFVKCYWTLESPKVDAPEKQNIVPDGSMEMIFHYGDLYKQYLENGDSFIQPRCFVFGQLTRPLEIEPTGETGIISVRFNPEGFLPFATIPIKEMENKATSLEILFGEEGIKIEKDVINAKNTEERISLIEEFLLKRLTNNASIDRIVSTTVETILTANGQLPIQEITKQLNINRRQLERKFSTVIGLSPKQLSKTVRLQSTLKLLLEKKDTPFTSLAYQGEYYDQAHFNKDFKELTGFTPKDFYGSSLKMTSFFIGTD